MYIADICLNCKTQTVAVAVVVLKLSCMKKSTRNQRMDGSCTYGQSCVLCCEQMYVDRVAQSDWGTYLC
jgi:hypothetical protein